MNYIIFSGRIDIRKGGPSGYIANLSEGLKKIKSQETVKIISENSNTTFSKSKTSLSKFKSVLGKNSYLLEKFVEKKLIDFRDISIRNQLNNIKFTNEDLVHVHSVMDFNMLKQYNLKSKVILTPHTPESVADEYLELIRKDYNNPNIKLKKFIKKVKIIEKKAFEQCKYFIFPSIESMEIYGAFIENFNELMRSKKIYFNLTGSAPLTFKLDRNQFREKYNIPKNAFVISYVGRHNKIKGFDILKKVAEEIYKIDPSIIFVCAGTGPIKLDGPNVLEIGWTDDPGSIINASDLFILPNRNTYFDLILLEVLSLGIPVLASKTGGNKTIGKLTNGVRLFESENIYEIISNINELRQNKENLMKMGKENRECYNKQFTLDKFAARYLYILEKIKNDE